MAVIALKSTKYWKYFFLSFSNFTEIIRLALLELTKSWALKLIFHVLRQFNNGITFTLIDKIGMKFMAVVIRTKLPKRDNIWCCMPTNTSHYFRGGSREERLLLVNIERQYVIITWRVMVLPRYSNLLLMQSRSNMLQSDQSVCNVS